MAGQRGDLALRRPAAAVLVVEQVAGRRVVMQVDRAADRDGGEVPARQRAKCERRENRPVENDLVGAMDKIRKYIDVEAVDRCIEDEIVGSRSTGLRVCAEAARRRGVPRAARQLVVPELTDRVVLPR